ncbi:FAST kinase domain-containing protein 5, mitochondrial-like [Diprion similis]|uniref:FAST kinase domain-containing protein 5, mitochondrial-like n=1 Tax=Diprion similis TaxID=362088 RepID=UPI001EF94051|nr:FAST kinase domain-containing protein 5, mitochondrial-like [Diprion similis]
MYKFILSHRGVKILRQFGVRLDSARDLKSPQILAACTIRCNMSQVQFYSAWKKANDESIRKFFEYPEGNDSDTDIPQTRWDSVESSYAHRILEQRQSYKATVVYPPKVLENELISEEEVDKLTRTNWRLENVAKVVESFRKISHYACQKNENIYTHKYQLILLTLATNCNILSDEQLSHVLRSLMLWFIECINWESNFLHLYKILDQECRVRAEKWSRSQILLFCDHWYRLRLLQKSDFVKHAMINLGNNVSDLSQSNLVQLLFYVGIARSRLVNFKEIQVRLKLLVDDLDVDEIAIIALGFFKTRTPIRDRMLLTTMIRRTTEKVNVIEDISLAAILKISRLSIHHNDLWHLCQLLECTVPQIPRLSMTCLSHVVLAAAAKSLFHAELLNAATVRFYREISKVRMKDINSLVFALSSFHYVPNRQPDILNAVIDELNNSKRNFEIKLYPDCLAKCLHSLSLLNKRPKKLIARVLNPENIEKAYALDVNKCREIFALDLNVETEMPDYSGPRLDTYLRKNLAMIMTDSLPKSKDLQRTFTDYLKLDVIRVCEEYLGSKEMLHVDHVLPQYCHPDIIVCLDAMKRPIPISSMLSGIPLGTVKRAPRIDVYGTKWLAVVIGTRNAVAKNTNRVLGHFRAKFRQLEHIGYDPVLIHWQDWILLKNDEQKFKYLQCKVFR